MNVGNIDASFLINDLAAVPIDALTVEESREFIRSILGTYGYTIAEDQVHYLIKKVGWCIPFYFQLLIQEIFYLIEPGQEISNFVIDESFLNAVRMRNDHLFAHYVIRLKRVFNEQERNFVKKLLCQLCTSSSIDREEAINLASGLLTENQMSRLMEALKYDGYIVEVNENFYKFNSPLLMHWWKLNEC